MSNRERLSTEEMQKRKADYEASLELPAAPTPVNLDRGGDTGPDGHGRPEQESAYVPVPVEVGGGKVAVKLMHVSRNRQPAVIKMLSLGGGHALDRYIGLGEKIGAVSAVELDSPVDGGKLSDGGVTQRVADAAELRRVLAYMRGVYVQHPSKTISRTRRAMPVLTVLNNVGVRWVKPKEILARHQWGCRSNTLFTVNQAFGWSVLQLKIAFGIEDFSRVFEPLPDYLVRLDNPDHRPILEAPDTDTGRPATGDDHRPSS